MARSASSGCFARRNSAGEFAIVQQPHDARQQAQMLQLLPGRSRHDKHQIHRIPPFGLGRDRFGQSGQAGQGSRQSFQIGVGYHHAPAQIRRSQPLPLPQGEGEPFALGLGDRSPFRQVAGYRGDTRFEVDRGEIERNTARVEQLRQFYHRGSP